MFTFSCASKLILLSLIFSSLNFSPVHAEFFDIYEENPLYKPLHELESRGIITSTPLENFEPDKLISKSEFTEWLMRSIGVKYQTPGKIIDLLDFDKDNSKAPYVYKALELGIIDAPNNYFNGNGGITRVKALQMAFKAEGVHVPLFIDDASWPFTDLSPKNSSAPFMVKAYEMGIFKGQNNISPFKLITKAEAVEIISRLQSDRKSYPEIVIKEKTNTSGANLQIYDTQLDQNDIPQIDIFLHVYDKINQEYFQKEEINSDNLINAAIKGMVSTLSDPYTYYAEPKQDQQMVSDILQSEFTGIGAEIAEIEGAITIISPIKGGPADHAGLKPYDIIKAVNGLDLTGYSSSQATQFIRGPEGTKVELSIFRPGSKENLQISIIRKKIEISSVTVDFHGDIAVISISLFRNNSTDQFAAIAQEVIQKGAKGIILDLRDNAGGYLEASTDISSYFLPEGANIASVLDVKGNEIIYFSIGPSILEKIPTVVLINKGSASASEIIAGALQDNKQATIIGDLSFGKGSVQKLYMYYNGAEFKLTIAKWLTPNGISISEKGISPDIEISNNIDPLHRTTDKQLLKALEFLR